jgi:hypothetical protein
MSDKYNINNYNHVKVEKLGGSVQEERNGNDNKDKTRYAQLKVQEYTDSNSSSSSSSITGDDDDFNEDDNTSGIETDDDTEAEAESDTSSVLKRLNLAHDPLVGGKKNSDTDSLSSVSTTEILSKDPLFLVLSEFLMDNETGDNIVSVGNNIVTVLSKINSKLGRIADILEKKHKHSKKRKE